MNDRRLAELESRVATLEKEITELKGQVSVRPRVDVGKVAEEIATRLQKSSAKHHIKEF